MTAVIGGDAQWWLVLAGWSLVVALWHTSAVALGLSTWLLWRRAASSRRHYLAASSALAIATVLTLATPAVLLIQSRTALPTVAVPAVSIGAVVAPVMPGSSVPVAAPGPDWRQSARDAVAAAMPWVGALWAVGFVVGLVRLGGGWGLALFIRRRASAVRSASVVEAAAAVTATWALPSATLLYSTYVDAPVVVGARSPAVLLPIDLEQRLDADALLPLLAHELAHVERRDYAANLVQSVADALLFFSPGARWMSRRVRETREYCCDDVVAARCGTGAYVSALTTLAGLDVATRARPALNAAGPRLIVRIRRLIQDDTVTPHTSLRHAALAVGLLLVAMSTPAILSASAAAVESARIRAQAVVESPMILPITVSFVREQPGFAVIVESIEPTAGGVCGVATLYNGADIAVAGVRFVAAFSKMSGRPVSGLAISEPRAVPVQPGTRAAVAANLMPANDALAIGGAGRVHVKCSLFSVDFANGTRWSAPPTASGSSIAVAPAARRLPAEPVTQPVTDIPMGFVHTQPGAALRLRSMRPTSAGLCGVADVENLAAVAITGLRFAAFAHAQGPTPAGQRSHLGSGTFGTSALLPVQVAPQQMATVDVGLMSEADVHANLRVDKAQAMCAVAEIRYADGAVWEMKGHTIFGPEHAEVPRSLIGAAPTAGAPLCRDSSGGWLSPGGVVPISGEGLQFAQCQNGIWREYDLPPMSPIAAQP